MLIKKEGIFFEEIPSNVELIYCLDEGNRVIFNFYKVFYKILETAKRVDVIVGAMELMPTYFAAIVGFLLKKPTIGWVHTNLKKYLSKENFLYVKIFNYFYSKLSAIIVVSQGAADELLDLIPSSSPKIKRLYNFILLDKIISLSQTPLPYEPTINHPRILAVGRLVREKGFDLLIRAHANLINSGIVNTLIIVGEGPEKDLLEKLIIEFDVSKSVVLLGFQSNPYSWMRFADVLVLPSRFEGFGLVLLEAMLLGLPVIASDCPSGPAEILHKGRYGLLFQSENVTDLSNAIMRLLSDFRLLERLRKIGPSRAMNFSSSIIVPEFEKVFEELVK